VVPHWYAGGPALAAWRGLPPVGERSPEEWIGATVARFGEPNLGPARLADGTLLQDAVRDDPRGWLGRDDGEPGDTGVLVKLLDAGQRLPVHVHPTRAFASRHLGVPTERRKRGTSSRPMTTLRCGWVGAKRLSPTGSRLWSTRRTLTRMLTLMHRIPVRRAMECLVPGGTLHAIGQGVLLVEAQEPTDQSILLERVNTTASEAEIFLGLDRDVALSAVDSAALTDVARLMLHAAIDGGLTPVPPVAAAPYFRMDLLPPGLTPANVGGGIQGRAPGRSARRTASPLR
jgi:mannose-6-phosphate isomerase